MGPVQRSSQVYPINGRVSQGSMASPPLFCLYINDLVLLSILMLFSALNCDQACFMGTA